MSANVNTYLALVTSEHNLRPNFMAMLAAFLQPHVDQQNGMESFTDLFDVDLAVGDQLDKIGQWVGVSRNLTKVIFGLTKLDDASYRVLLKLFIAQNTWNGTVPGIYSIWNAILAPSYGSILVQDNQDMTMLVVMLTPPGGVLILAVLVQGYFLMRPAGVRISGFFEPSLPFPATPLFGFDVENATISGFDVGAWVVLINPILVEPITLDRFHPLYQDLIVVFPVRSPDLRQTLNDPNLLTQLETVSIDKFGPHYSDGVGSLPSTAIRAGVGAVKQVI
jgi:uncharacterized protein DUF2612